MDIKDYILSDKNCTYIKVKVIPKSIKNELFSVMDDGTLKIRIMAVAEKGKANKELISFISKQIGVDREDIQIISGATSQVKIIRIKF